MTSIIEKFDAAFNKAIQNPANSSQDGNINFNYVESDVWFALCNNYTRVEIKEVMESEFNFAAAEWANNTFNEVKEHFAG